MSGLEAAWRHHYTEPEHDPEDAPETAAERLHRADPDDLPHEENR